MDDGNLFQIGIYRVHLFTRRQQITDRIFHINGKIECFSSDSLFEIFFLSQGSSKPPNELINPTDDPVRAKMYLPDTLFSTVLGLLQNDSRTRIFVPNDSHPEKLAFYTPDYIP